nr:vWA domain-containing protein [uncultured Intestinibacter sp.]
MKDRLTKLFTTFLAVVLLVGMSPAAASTAYAASWNSGTVASLNLGNKLSGFFDRLFGSSNKNDSNPGQTGQTEEKDSTEQVGNQLTANGGTSNDPVTEDDITLTKTAEDKGKDKDTGEQLFDIKLGVQGTEKRTSKKVDIVLILDASSSMTTSLQKMTKKAAKTFVQKVFADTGVNPSVAVVSYGSTACARNYSRGSWTFYGSSFSSNNYSSDKDAIETAIDNAYSVNNGGGTNTEGAFLVAKELTSSNVKRSDAEHLTVFMTDGVPTQHYYTDRWGDLDNDGGGNYTTIEDQNEAIDAAISLSEDSSIYNVALTGGIKGNTNQTTEERRLVAEKFMNQPPYKMTNDGTGRNQSLTFESKPSQSYAKAYYNITTTNENDASSQMEEIYRNIASQAISLVKNGVVTDILPADFKLTEEGKQALRDAKATFTENSDGTTTITYTNVPAEKVVTNLPTISVKYIGNGYGAAYTNSSATYSGKLYDGTDSGKDFTKDFPKPVAGLHPKTQPDTDSTYVGTTIDVDVASNDDFTKLTVPGYGVSEYEIVLTNEKGEEIEYNDDFIATMKNNQLQFTSKTTGTKVLYYVVKATLDPKNDKNFAKNGKTNLISKPTKVTINVTGPANKAFVIDFGKPVTYEASDVFDDNELKSEISLPITKGYYGNLTLNSGNSITYKLTKFMDNIDVFTFKEKYNENVTVDKTVSMVPASSIYYEDNFADESGNTLINYEKGWKVAPLKPGTDKVIDDIISEVAGKGNLGYDPNYNTGTSELAYSAGTIHYVPKSDKITKATFTFKGQGIDLYSYTSGATGRVTISITDITDGNNKEVFYKTINTKYNSGEAYQVPVVTFMGEKTQNYRVQIIVPKNNAFYLDAVRIYNSVNVNKEQIGGVDVDNESSAKFVSIREQSLLSNNADLFTVDGDVFIDAYLKKNAKVVAIPKEMTEYKTYGRKTEVVVAPGSSVTLTLKNASKYSKVQLGARIDAAIPSVIDGVDLSKVNTNGKVLVNNEEINIKSSTDMYYTVKIVDGKLVITNNTNKLLALTKLKLVEKVEK